MGLFDIFKKKEVKQEIDWNQDILAAYMESKMIAFISLIRVQLSGEI